MRLEEKEKCEYSEEDIQKAVEALQRLADVIRVVLMPILETVMETLKKFMDAVLHTYPNKRVIYLAVYHPKERVRKKNMHRIMRWIEREMKRGAYNEETV